MVIETMRPLMITIGMVILIPLTVFWGMKVFLPQPAYPSDSPDVTASYQELSRLEQQLREAEERSLTDDVSRLQQELEVAIQKKDALETPIHDHYSKELDHYRLLYFLIFACMGIACILLSFAVLPAILGGGFLGGGVASLVAGILDWIYDYSEVHFLLVFIAFGLLLLLSFLYARSCRMVFPHEAIRKIIISISIAILLACTIYLGLKVLRDRFHVYLPWIVAGFPLSLGVVILGFFIPIAFMSSGFIIGGIFSQLIGTLFSFINTANNFLMFLVMLVVLIVLSYLRLIRKRN